MPDPLSSRVATPDLLQLVTRRAAEYLATLGERPVSSDAVGNASAEIDCVFPEGGHGAAAAVEQLMRIGTAVSIHSAGPRYFHFVTGGATPAALAADWLTSVFDQNAAAWECSPFATELETVTLNWLKQLFGIPSEFGGIILTSATMANFVGLSCARHWWAEQHGVDLTSAGMAGLGNMPVFTSGYVHVSVIKALQMLGCGRQSLRVLSQDDTGRLDANGIVAALRAVRGPAVIVGTAGEVNAGCFDPIDQMADLAEEFGAWLHIDGAFGLFAALSPRTAHLVSSAGRADSVISDGHKWLNVPYDSAFAFIRDRSRMVKTFGAPGAAYLPGPDSPHVNYEDYGPDASRRARSLPIWATLYAYGRTGYREMIDRHLDLAQHLGRLVESSPDLELLAPVQLCNICFRYRHPDMDERALDTVNAEIGRALTADGRVLAGTTVYRGRTALRPAIVNWSSTDDDIELLVRVVRELGARISGQ
jgi:glutamate/tyrosine decarboxylase-like PLP-dependent enzyme